MSKLILKQLSVKLSQKEAAMLTGGAVGGLIGFGTGAIGSLSGDTIGGTRYFPKARNAVVRGILTGGSYGLGTYAATGNPSLASLKSPQS